MSVRPPVRALELGIALGVLALAALGCSQDPPPESFARDTGATEVRAPSPSPAPSSPPALAAAVTATPSPTATASPTPTPPPTETPLPTSTPSPTPTVTPPPSPTPSPTPTPQRFTLAASVEPPGAALIELDPPPSSDGLYLADTVVTLRLVDTQPDASFVWWDGDVSGAGHQVTVTVDRDLRVRALFMIHDTPTPTAVPTATGTATPTPAPTSTATPEPSPTSTAVPLPTASPTPAATATASPTPLPTLTPAPGALRWSHPTGSWIDAAPAIDGDVVYIGSQDRHLYALETSGGTPVWDYPADSGITGTAAVTQSLVIFGTLGGKVLGVDKANGERVWTFAAGSNIWSGVTVRDGAVFVGSEDGNLYALDTASGSLVWEFETGGPILGGPAVAGDTVYAASSDEHVYAVDASTGEVRWKAELQWRSVSTPLVLGGFVYVGSLDEHLYALDASTGRLAWTFWSGDSVLTSAAAADGRVFFGSDDGRIYALDIRDGSVLWSFATGGEVRSSPVIENGVVFAGSDDDHLYALDAATGVQLWRFATGDDVQARAAVRSGTVFFGSHDRQVYAVAAGAATPLAEAPTPTATPSTSFTPLTPDELKTRLDFAFATSLDVERFGVESGPQGSTQVRISLSGEVIEIFENGYFLLTGRTPHQDGWVPRIFSGDEYLAYIDEYGGGSAFLKAALGFCCSRTDAGLELIIRGDRPVSSVISTVAHEAGHARQKMANPVQDKGEFGSDLAALQEAEAYAFEAALTRKLGEHAGINTSVFPDIPGIQAYVDEFREFLRESLDARLEFHRRGMLFVWLAALHDPELSHLKSALMNRETLSPEAMLELHDRLTRLTPAEVGPYVDNLTQSVSDDLNFILGTIDRRIGYHVDYTGLIENVPELTLMP